MNENIKRIQYIDIAKGILIILVVIGHVINFNTLPTRLLKVWIYSFHIPVFFIISGILINKSNLVNTSFDVFLKKKILRLIAPYIFFELTTGLLQMVINGRAFSEVLYRMITLRCNQGADWFLPTLFIADIIVFILIKELRSNTNIFINCCVFFILAIILPEPVYFIGVMRRILIAVSFILVGYLFKNIVIEIMYKKKLMIYFFITSLFIARLNGIVDLSVRQFNNPILYLLGGIIGSLFIIYCSGMLDIKLLSYIGKNSLIVMGTHQNILLIADTIINRNAYYLFEQVYLLIIILGYEFLTIFLYSNYLPIFKNQYKNYKFFNEERFNGKDSFKKN